VKVRELPFALLSAILLGAVVVWLSRGFDLGLSGGDNGANFQVSDLGELRNGLTLGGKSSYQIEKLETPIDVLSYLPLGVSRFLFAPFPWSVSSWRQAIAIPETLLVWYYLFWCSVRGAVSCVKRVGGQAVVPLFVATALTLGYGLVEGNEGTAYRHRAQVVVILLAFAAIHLERRKVERQAKAAVQAPTPFEQAAAPSA
jgi:hypothetical protein